jgi:hypothetical protein
MTVVELHGQRFSQQTISKRRNCYRSEQVSASAQIEIGWVTDHPKACRDQWCRNENRNSFHSSGPRIWNYSKYCLVYKPSKSDRQHENEIPLVKDLGQPPLFIQSGGKITKASQPKRIASGSATSKRIRRFQSTGLERIVVTTCPSISVGKGLRARRHPRGAVESPATYHSLADKMPRAGILSRTPEVVPSG